MSGVGVFIGETEMTATGHGHIARREGPGWSLSWLPGRVLSRNQAVTGMLLANLVGAEIGSAARPAGLVARWEREDPARAGRVTAWAAELGITAGDVVALLGGPPGVPAAAVEDAADDADDADGAARAYERDVARAVQVAADDEVAYGPTGDVRLLRDPYDILADAGSAAVAGDDADDGWGP